VLYLIAPDGARGFVCQGTGEKTGTEGSENEEKSMPAQNVGGSRSTSLLRNLCAHGEVLTTQAQALGGCNVTCRCSIQCSVQYCTAQYCTVHDKKLQFNSLTLDFSLTSAIFWAKRPRYLT